MANFKRLPDSEFELMRIVWRNEPPVTTTKIIHELGEGVNWKPQTVLTMLVRLIEKGFLSSERVGKERNYTPIISQSQYMNVETGEFMFRYRGNSVGSLVKTMYDGKDLTEEELTELKNWLKELGG